MWYDRVAFLSSFFFSNSRNFLTSYDKESIFTMDHFPLWYRRAAEHPPGSFIYSLSFEEEAGTYNELLCLKTADA